MGSLGFHKETLTVAEAAKVCGVNRVTMWRWVKSNDLPATTTLGGHHRIRKSDLTDFLVKNLQVPGGRASRKRILIADDDPHVQKLMGRTIEMEGHDVECCSNGFEAGIRVMRFRPHLILLDLFMPYMNGFQVCRQLKGDPETAAIKIIAISGHYAQHNIEKALRCGADLFVKKPFKKKQLVQQIASLLDPATAIPADPYV
ncbi:MAG: response regulator [Desulfobacteraceae bacterium]|jgi:excisionase family DNA binding protein